MYDLLKKLNTLVSAQVNDAISRLPALERSPDLARQVSDLRQRVAAALEHEDSLRAQVATLQQEIAGLDKRIDDAIAAGLETQARQLLEEVQRLQKRLAMAESDLHQHQNAAADLIIRVNEMEAAIGDLKSTQTSAPAPAAAPPTERVPDAVKRRPVTDFMPPVEDAAPEKPSAKPAQKPAAETPSAAPVEAPIAEAASPRKSTKKPLKTDTPAAETEASASEAPAAADEPAAHVPPEPRQPWDKPRTAKEAAEWAREDAKQAREQAETGVSQVGGLLRDIQSRVEQRMQDLDRMLEEGGLTDDFETLPPPSPKTKPAPKKSAPDKPDDDLNDRLSRLTKPE